MNRQPYGPARFASVFPSGNQPVRLAVRGADFPDRAGVVGWGSLAHRCFIRNRTMSDELLYASIGASAAIAGGILTGVFDGLRQYIMRPVLRLSFKERDEAYCVESTYEVDSQSRTSTFIRVRLVNSGRSVARDCRVFITEIKELNGMQTHPTKFYDAKELPWAGYPQDYSSRPIPPGINSYVDVIRFSKGESSWNFRVKALFASQESIKNYKGTYRLKVVATADNAKPTEVEFNVTYTGDYTSLRTTHV